MATGCPGRSLGTLFAATVGARPRAPALIDGERRLDFAGLARQVDGLAAGLHALGVEPGDVVAYQLPNWWEAAVVFLAAARIGAIVNPLLPAFREHELRFTLAQSGAVVLFVPAQFRGCDHPRLIEGLRPELPRLRHVGVCRDGGAESMPFARAGATPPAVPVDADSLLLLMYTSGTTAAPKGVLHTHDTLGAEILSLARVHALGPGDRGLVPSPLTHVSGVIHGILVPAILGTAAVLMDQWEPAEARRRIATEGVTYMAGAPTFLRDLIAAERVDDLASLRLFSCGGAAVPADLVREARRRLPGCLAKRVYGSTEFPTITTTDAADAVTHGIDTEGRAIAPAEVRIAAGEPPRALTAGEEGEVQARGPECFVGYSDPTLNAGAFTTDGWYRTGDLGVIDSRGYLRIRGRLKEIVVRKGEKISILEVEQALARHPAVAEAAVLALADEETGERACAVVVLCPGAALTLADLGAFLAEHGLARHKHPERLVLVAEMPRTASGKVARAELERRLTALGR